MPSSSTQMGTQPHSEIPRAGTGANHFELTTGEDDKAAIALSESRGFTNHEGAPDGPRMLYYEIDL